MCMQVNMCLHVHASEYVCMRVCMLHACVYVFTCACVYICAVCMHVYVCACVHVRLCVFAGVYAAMLAFACVSRN